MTKVCDHTSVGVIIENGAGEMLLIKRARFPVGIAPPAGHIDDHGSPVQTAIAEVEEEVGLRLQPKDLTPTTIQNRRVDNRCRREGGDYHNWWVYQTSAFKGNVNPSPDETEGAAWCTPQQLQVLADRTRAFRTGSIRGEFWQADPGLEEIWLDFLTELGYVS